MPVSSFGDVRDTMNYNAPTTAYPGDCYVGTLYLGGTKTADYRGLMRFDLGAPTSGPPITGLVVPDDAWIVATVENTNFTADFPATLDRVTRDDWDYLTATWQQYKTGSNWTTGGGDVGTPPPAVGYTAPKSAGQLTITGLLENVLDAVANRAGLVHLRHKQNDETLGAWIRITAATLYVSYTSLDTPVAEPTRQELPRPRAQPGRAPAGALLPARPVRPVRPTRSRP